MKKKCKRLRKAFEDFDFEKSYKVDEALDFIKSVPVTKFDQSLDLSLHLGVDPRKADQMVRGTVSLPHGSGKKVKVLVFAKGDKAKEAEEAGADYVGSEELQAKVKGGFKDFNVVIATPDQMRVVGQLGKVLGPRGLMPSPKAGTVTTDPATAIKDLKKGKIEFKVDKNSNINLMLGKLSFTAEQLADNVKAVVQAIVRMRPASLKGSMVVSMHLSSTMGPGVRIDHQTI
jgi:large subunit ribosomal protein L1